MTVPNEHDQLQGLRRTIDFWRKKFAGSSRATRATTPSCSWQIGATESLLTRPVAIHVCGKPPKTFKVRSFPGRDRSNSQRIPVPEMNSGWLALVAESEVCGTGDPPSRMLLVSAVMVVAILVAGMMWCKARKSPLYQLACCLPPS